MGKSFNGDDRSRDSDSDAEEKEALKFVAALEAISKRLEGPVQKYPRSGKGLFKKMQERFIAATPGDEGMDELSAWKSGQLAYWENESQFRQLAVPKGSVVLLKIAKVAVSKEDSRGRSVIVKHKSGDDMHELVLCFPTKRDAEEWSYTLWEFISKLRGHSLGSMNQYGESASAMF